MRPLYPRTFRTTAEKTGPCGLQFAVTAVTAATILQWKHCLQLAPQFSWKDAKIQAAKIPITGYRKTWSLAVSSAACAGHLSSVSKGRVDIDACGYEVPVGGGMSCGVQPPSPSPSRAALSPVWTMWPGYQHFLILLTLAPASTLHNNNTRRDRFFK